MTDRRTASNWTRRGCLALGLSAGLALAAGQPAMAEGFPDGPVTIVVAYAAGGGTDTAVRALTDVMSEKLGQPVLVQNVKGAGGGVAAAQIARAKADGYTLLATNSTSITLVPQVQKTLYDLDSFVHVGMIGEFQNAVFTNSNKPYKTLDELIETVKAEGRPIKLGSYLTLDRLLLQYIAKERGVQVVPVPVSGGSGAVQAVLSGDVDVAFSGGSWAPIVRAGDAVALFAASYEPLKVAPDLVSMKALGFPFGVSSHISLSAPAGTPQEAIDKIAEALEAAVSSDLAQTVGEKRNMDMTFQGPAEASATMQKEHDVYAEIIKTTSE